MSLQRILKLLCAAPGVSGDEHCAALAAKELLSEFARTEIDALGNVTGRIDGKGKHILLDAHIDQIGLIITQADKSGFLRFARCGGADERLLCGAQVTVHGTKPLYGIICSTPPHLTKPEDRGKPVSADKLGIDIGLSYDKACELVNPGDRVTFNGEYIELLNGRVCSPSLDDRAGVAVVLRTLELLRQSGTNANITVVFSSREETGGGGARAAAFTAAPELAIAYDVSFGDSPGVPERECKSLGTGAMIGCSPMLSRRITNELTSVAVKHSLPYTTEVMRGRTGTNADDITASLGGIETGLISMPIRNMHSPVEVAQLSDLEACALLTAKFIEEAANNA